jgi:DNA (cytosine-5)-methyltransferase 1
MENPSGGRRRPTQKRAAPSLLQELPKWRAAREIIDWSNPGRSLLDDPKYRKKPLTEKTRRRIAKGLERFGGPLAHLYIRLLNLPQDSSAATQDNFPAAQNNPTPAQESFILNRNGENDSTKAHSIDNPMPTATTRRAGYLVEPEAQPFHGSDRQHTAPRSPEEPLHTITTLTGVGLYLA